MKNSLLFLLGLIACLNGYSQYTLTTFNDEYTPLENGVIPNGVFEGWDDPSFNIPLGFDFTMGTLSFNEIIQDGLGAVLLGGNYDDGAIVAYLSDIIDGGEIPEEVSSVISFTLTGNPGNQILKIEFANVAFYAEVAGLNTAGNRSNFQIWYYESDFSIEMRFGESNISNPQLAYEGLNGPSIGLFLGIANDGETLEYGVILTGNPASPELQSVNIDDDIFTLGLDGTPANGQVYRFAPTVVSVEEQTLSDFAVFPNPAMDKLQIDGNLPANIAYQITDITGKKIMSGNYNASHTIDVSTLNSGVYILALDGYATMSKFMKK